MMSLPLFLEFDTSVIHNSGGVTFLRLFVQVCAVSTTQGFLGYLFHHQVPMSVIAVGPRTFLCVDRMQMSVALRITSCSSPGGDLSQISALTKLCKSGSRSFSSLICASALGHSNTLKTSNQQTKTRGLFGRSTAITRQRIFFKF